MTGLPTSRAQTAVAIGQAELVLRLLSMMFWFQVWGFPPLAGLEFVRGVTPHKQSENKRSCSEVSLVTPFTHGPL